MSGRLVVGLNPHGEVTSLLFPGRVVMQKQTLLSCIRNAFSKAKAIAEAVQQAVEENLTQHKATLIKPQGYEVKNLRSDSGYNRWLIEQRINKKKLKFEEGGVPMDEDEQGTEAAQDDSRVREETVERPPDTFTQAPDDSPIMEVDSTVKNISEQDGKETDKMEEEEEVKSRLKASDLF